MDNVNVNGSDVQETKPVDPTGKNKGESAKTKRIDVIITQCANSVASFVRSSDANDVKSRVKNILSTISAINATEEFATGLRVDGELYRFNEYKAPAKMQTLITGAKVVCVDTITAIDFLDHEEYKAECGKILTPGDFMLSCKKVCAALRVNPEFKELSRPSVVLLSEAAKYAINGRKANDGQTAKIYFLTLKVDDEASLPIKEWAKRVSEKLFA